MRFRSAILVIGTLPGGLYMEALSLSDEPLEEGI
jgi:hypothetical protein